MSTLQVATVKSNSSAAPVFQNTSGTEIGSLPKMWINFNGTGTIAIRDDFNVSSITDNGTGDYSVSFTNAMSDTNYCTLGTSNYSRTPGTGRLFTGFRSNATGSVRVQLLGDGGQEFDSEDVCIAIFGD